MIDTTKPLTLVVTLCLSTLTLSAEAQTTHNTLPECHAAKGARHIVLRSDGRCDAFTAQDIGKLPDHAKPGPAAAPGPTHEERLKALEDKVR